MQITPELIQGVRMAGNMAQNLMGGANKLMGSDQAREKAEAKAAAVSAAEKELRRGMRLAVYSMLECSVEYETIVRMLEKYWELPGSDARAFVTRMQTVEFPVKNLKLYLQSQGWTAEQIARFIKARNVKDVLGTDPTHELFKLSPEQLAYRLSGRV